MVLCVDERPKMQVLVRRVSTQPMRRDHRARRAFEYMRHGTVTFLVSLNVYEGRLGGVVWKPTTTSISCGQSDS